MGLAASAEAQLGRLKDAAKQAVGNVAGTSSPSSASAPHATASAPNANVIAITDRVPDGVVKVLGIDEEMRVLETERVALIEHDGGMTHQQYQIVIERVTPSARSWRRTAASRSGGCRSRADGEGERRAWAGMRRVPLALEVFARLP